jgi:hypothetical protein
MNFGMLSLSSLSFENVSYFLLLEDPSEFPVSFPEDSPDECPLSPGWTFLEVLLLVWPLIPRINVVSLVIVYLSVILYCVVVIY